VASEPTESSVQQRAVITVWASGLAPAATGVGVFQRQVYSRLAADPSFRVVLGPTHERWSAELGDYRPGLRRVRDGADFLRHLVMSTGDANVALITTTPLPAAIRQSFVGVVYDLRWQRTRGLIAKLYRHLDLARLVRKARRLIAISDRTRTDLVALFPAAAPKTTVVYLGPGNARADFDRLKQPATVLLVGSAPYKRNRLAAETLSRLRPAWANRILGLSLGTEVMAIFEESFGKGRCQWFSGLDEMEVGEVYARAETFLCLSLEEGFGLPFIEALTAGCHVIAVRQPLTESLLQDSAVLLADGSSEILAGQLATRPVSSWPSQEVRASVAVQFSWDTTTRAIAQALREAAGR
jgi:glycosyltransferase involved in cell wall biosynthesis